MEKGLKKESKCRVKGDNEKEYWRGKQERHDGLGKINNGQIKRNKQLKYI